MKLKKVISLVLGGVMALSMLAGCSTSEEEGTVTLAETPTSNTAVVAQVSAKFTANTVGDAQTKTVLTGNETADLASAIQEIDTSTAIALNAVGGTVVQALANPATTTVITVTKGAGETDADLGTEIYNGVAAAYNTGAYRMAKLSVFDASVVAAAAATNTTTTVAGTTVASAGATTTNYWVIVITTAGTAAADTGLLA